MAEPVMRHLAGSCLCLAVWMASGPACAQANDPTRPPAAALAGEPGEGADLLPVGPRLQSVLIGYGTPPRKLAVIDGKAVRVGDKVGAATVQAISAREVVLRTGHEHQVLKLYPDADGPADAAGKSGKQHNKMHDK
jgi:MSHA biogenesis protein MshK